MFRNVVFNAHICIQNKNCIKMSTNMPMFGPVVLEIACDSFIIIRSCFNWIVWLTIFLSSLEPIFETKISKNFRTVVFNAFIWIQHRKCIKTSTIMPMFGSMVLEIAYDSFTIMRCCFHWIMWLVWRDRGNWRWVLHLILLTMILIKGNRTCLFWHHLLSPGIELRTLMRLNMKTCWG